MKECAPSRATRYFSRKEAAEFLRVSVRFLADDAVTRRYRIPFSRIGSRCIYDQTELEEYMRKHRCADAA